jgi:hypothetical protein
MSATPAYAYVGPGSSLGAVGVFIGIVATVFLALVSFVWYPFKRLARRLRHKGGAIDNKAE